ncbi:DUF6371 domain-containing protein [Emticicia sp. 21SJ11W-3]|uniref:DUF6371 domain-containing protein n=1 Tax=Emticicia sp. 21SJ11W-3 TaxID=2916755 RepID=UPI0020A2079D|nr:DUF6371 domain-containing protein [Emticicia sp. 21SJ11W-3]UTA69567.1 DUF6371 domain-containing protein [Emticicia sp. 21SJ11W-3]
MENYQFLLEPYKGMKTRYTCPNCGEKHAFTRYINAETGEHLADDVGRCNREIKCGYHYTPRQYFQDNPTDTVKVRPYKPLPEKLVSYIENEIFLASLKPNQPNNLLAFLRHTFGEVRTNLLIKRYFIGTSKHWAGATVFWQIDTRRRIRSGKIMLYNTATGKRIKEPVSLISWVHSVLNLPDFNLKQCFFGEHLLINNTKPVAIVESEKTALIASLYEPRFTWLAAGSLNSLSADKCKVLEGRKVFLFPDVNAFEKWQAKVQEFRWGSQWVVSDVLEKIATDQDRQQGLDLADYLLRSGNEKPRLYRQ